MRSYREIVRDCVRATNRGNAHSLWVLAEELDQLADPEARTKATFYSGIASRLDDDLQRAEACFNSALTDYQHLNDLAGIGAVHNELSTLYLLRGVGSEALEHASMAVRAAEELGDRRSLAVSVASLASAHDVLGSHELALSTYHQSLEIFESIDDQLAAAKVKENIASLFVVLGEFTPALDLLSSAASSFQLADYQRGVANVTLHQGNVYYCKGDFPKALERYEEAQTLYSELGHQKGIAVVLANLGNLYLETRDGDRARTLYRAALDISEKLGDQGKIAHTKLLIGIAALDQGEYAAAESYLLESLEVLHSLRNRTLAQDATIFLASLYTKLDRWSDAQSAITQLDGAVIESPETRAKYYMARGTIMQHQGEYSEAEDHFNMAIDLHRQHGYANEEVDALRHLRDLAAVRGDLAGYIQYNERFVALAEETRGAKAQTRIALRAKEHEIALARHERGLEQLKNEKLEDTLLRQQQLLSSYAANLVRQTEMVEDLRSSILTMIKQSVSPDGAVAAIQDSLSDQPTAESNWRRFFVQFHHVYPEFEPALRDHTPTISPTELKICCLVMMGMVTREIATLLFVSERTIDIHRGHIRKKLGVDRNMDLRLALIQAVSK